MGANLSGAPREKGGGGCESKGIDIRALNGRSDMVGLY